MVLPPSKFNDIIPEQNNRLCWTFDDDGSNCC